MCLVKDILIAINEHRSRYPEHHIYLGHIRFGIICVELIMSIRRSGFLPN